MTTVTRPTGMTLVELLVCLGIVTLGLALSLGPWQTFVTRYALTAQANTLTGLVHAARGRAAGALPILLCSRMGKCNDFLTPDDAIILVRDLNRNFAFDQGEPMETALTLPQGMTVQWRSFRAKPWLHFNSRGVAYYQNGHFLLCYRGKAKKVIVTRQARPRVKPGDADISRCPAYP